MIKNLKCLKNKNRLKTFEHENWLRNKNAEPHFKKQCSYKKYGVYVNMFWHYFMPCHSDSEFLETAPTPNPAPTPNTAPTPGWAGTTFEVTRPFGQEQ